MSETLLFDRATLRRKPTEAQLARFKASKKRLDEIDTKVLLEDIRAFLAENDDHTARSLRERMDALELGW